MTPIPLIHRHVPFHKALWPLLLPLYFYLTCNETLFSLWPAALTSSTCLTTPAAHALCSRSGRRTDRTDGGQGPRKEWKDGQGRGTDWQGIEAAAAFVRRGWHWQRNFGNRQDRQHCRGRHAVSSLIISSSPGSPISQLFSSPSLLFSPSSILPACPFNWHVMYVPHSYITTTSPPPTFFFFPFPPPLILCVSNIVSHPKTGGFLVSS